MTPEEKYKDKIAAGEMRVESVNPPDVFWQYKKDKWFLLSLTFVFLVGYFSVNVLEKFANACEPFLGVSATIAILGVIIAFFCVLLCLMMLKGKSIYTATQASGWFLSPQLSTYKYRVYVKISNKLAKRLYIGFIIFCLFTLITMPLLIGFYILRAPITGQMTSFHEANAAMMKKCEPFELRQ